MKCPNCNGVPYDEVWTCEVCNGKGVVEPLTNEEWLRSATTEELATIIYGIAVYDTLYDRIINIANPLYDDGTAGVKVVLEWLKERHDGNMG